MLFDCRNRLPLVVLLLLSSGILAALGHWHNEFYMGKQLVSSDFSDHPCRRPCHPGEPPMTCEYVLHISWYSTMGRACFYCPNVVSHCFLPGCIPGSGTQRGIVVANRRLPGPSIEVCVGDRIQVHVVNLMQNGETVAIHWHGIHQARTPYMDGAPMYTQCPILPGTNFTYDFVADIPGTYFWHGFTGAQRADGLAGPLIVRQHEDPQKTLYDLDNLPPVMIQDWYPMETGMSRFATFNFGNAGSVVPQLLLNGIWPTPGILGVNHHKLPPFPVPLPAFEYYLDPKFRYRFRIISNAFWLTPVKVHMTGHNLVVIASDGQPIVPVATRTLTIMPGERFDFVPYFTGEEVTPDGVYLLTVAGLGEGATPTTRSFARIVYKHGVSPKPRSAGKATDCAVSKTVVNEINYFDWQGYPHGDDPASPGRKISQLRSLSNRESVAGTPDIKFIIEFDFELVEDPRLYPVHVVRQDGPEYSKFFPSVFITPRLNKITHVMPPVPMLSQGEEIPPEMFCSHRKQHCVRGQFCECIHTLDVPLGALVELILLDNGFSDEARTMDHPMHIHGYHFRVVAMDKVHLNFTAKEFMRLDQEGRIRRNLLYAPLKDIVGVPAGGFTIVRFVADNPGIWLFHCHVDFHMEFGMAMVLRVGQRQDVPPPPPNFPRCHASWPLKPLPPRLPFAEGTGKVREEM